MWKRIGTAWSTYRQASAIKGLLEILGIWKPVCVGSSLALSAVTTVLLNLPPIWAVLAFLVVTAFLLFLWGLGTAIVNLRRIGRPQSVEESAIASRPSGWWIASGVLVCSLGAFGWLWSSQGATQQAERGTVPDTLRKTTNGVNTSRSSNGNVVVNPDFRNSGVAFHMEGTGSLQIYGGKIQDSEIGVENNGCGSVAASDIDMKSVKKGYLNTVPRGCGSAPAKSPSTPKDQKRD